MKGQLGPDPHLGALDQTTKRPGLFVGHTSGQGQQAGQRRLVGLAEVVRSRCGKVYDCLLEEHWALPQCFPNEAQQTCDPVSPRKAAAEANSASPNLRRLKLQEKACHGR